MLTNTELTQFLVSTVSLLILAHGVGYAFHLLHLPRVIGEISAGLLMGPSVLGVLMPEMTAWLISDQFPNGKLLSVIYWLGLILLMFTAGFKVQRNFDADDRRYTGLLLVGATVIPFAGGCAATNWIDLDRYMGQNGNAVALAIVFAIAVTVTSIPVISRIFIDLGMIETRFAKIVLAASTIQDVLLWAALAIATSLATAQSPSVMEASLAAGRTLYFSAAALLLGPTLLKLANQLRINFLLKASRLGYSLIWCLLMVSLAAALDVNVIFGAFLAGIVFGAMPAKEFEAAKREISSFGLGFFIPLYFAMVGFRVDLPNAFDMPLFLNFLIFSTIIVGACVFVTMRFSYFNTLTSFHFAVAMNTRGGPGIVLASVTFDFGLIDERLFVALVLAAIITSLAAGAWFRYAVAAGLPLLEKSLRRESLKP